VPDDLERYRRRDRETRARVFGGFLVLSLALIVYTLIHPSGWDGVGTRQPDIVLVVSVVMLGICIVGLGDLYITRERGRRD
jgi:hypothetical protein